MGLKTRQKLTWLGIGPGLQTAYISRRSGKRSQGHVGQGVSMQEIFKVWLIRQNGRPKVGMRSDGGSRKAWRGVPSPKPVVMGSVRRAHRASKHRSCIDSAIVFLNAKPAQQAARPLPDLRVEAVKPVANERVFRSRQSAKHDRGFEPVASKIPPGCEWRSDPVRQKADPAR